MKVVWKVAYIMTRAVRGSEVGEGIGVRLDDHRMHRGVGWRGLRGVAPLVAGQRAHAAAAAAARTGRQSGAGTGRGPALGQRAVT